MLHTLEAHKDGCVGMAANMIGVSRRVIAFDTKGSCNGILILKSGAFAPLSCTYLASFRRFIMAS